jgi:hypothetical protein
MAYGGRAPARHGAPAVVRVTAYLVFHRACEAASSLRCGEALSVATGSK